MNHEIKNPSFSLLFLAHLYLFFNKMDTISIHARPGLGKNTLRVSAKTL